MIFLLALFLISASNPAGGETLQLHVLIAPDAAGSLPEAAGLQEGMQRFFSAELGSSFPALDVSGDQASGQADGASGASARVSLEVSGNAVTVSTDLTRGRATRSLVSTVPAGSPASLVATAAGDLAFLYYSSRGFSTLPLSPAPALAASLSTDTLGILTGWNPEELEPVGLTASGDEITICFPHRYLTLGPLLRISASTIRDINGQSSGPEPMQLSGTVARRGGGLLLLSQRASRIAIVDPRLGTRQVIDAPALSALPARLIGDATLAALPGKIDAPGVSLYPLDGRPPGVVPFAGSYVPAFDVDREGNLWIWDSGERRVRVLTARGRELFAVRPLFSASVMQLPQQLAVLDDGSFLLAGSAEVWKFQGSGIPVWRLSRIPGRRSESLPPSFDLAADRSEGSFTILDAQSRRLLCFASGPAAPAGPPDSALVRLGAAGTETERSAARTALLREKGAGYASFADGLTRDLLYERADAALLRTSDTLRELAAESPDDAEAAAMLPAVLARRREIRAALTGQSEIAVVSARVLVGHPDPCETALTLEVTLRNSGAQALHGVRMHAGIPAAASAPALSTLDEIAPSEERDLRIPLGPSFAEALSPASTVQVCALVSYERGQEGMTRSLSFSAPVTEEGPPRSAAQILACRAVPKDTLAAGLSDTLLPGPRPDTPQPLEELAGILGCLGAARRQAHTEQGDAVPDLTMRNALRGLASDEADWTVVTASVASTLGMPAAVLCMGDRALALVDTGISLSDAQDAVPSLRRFREQLARLSPEGTLWLPLSGRVPSTGGNAALWALADGLAVLSGQDPARGSRSSISPSAEREVAPVPYPLVLPVSAERPSLDSLRDTVESTLAGAR